MSRRRARSRLDDAEQRRERKKRRERRQAGDGVPNGLVEIEGLITQEIHNIVDRVVESERLRDEHARVLARTPFDGGISIETESEKLAQHIADALARSRKADVTRAFDDAGKRRILTCRLP
jgi:hypothetical protein